MGRGERDGVDGGRYRAEPEAMEAVGTGLGHGKAACGAEAGSVSPETCREGGRGTLGREREVDARERSTQRF